MSIHSSHFQFIMFVLHFFSEEIIDSMENESYLLFCAMIKCTNEPVALNKQFQLTPANYVLAMPCGYIPNNLSQYFWLFPLSFWQHFPRMLYLKAIRNRFKGLA